jgi:hypothetical protein
MSISNFDCSRRILSVNFLIVGCGLGRCTLSVDGLHDHFGARKLTHRAQGKRSQGCAKDGTGWFFRDGGTGFHVVGEFDDRDAFRNRA